MASVGSISISKEPADKSEIFESLCRLSKWLEENEFSAYDVFDGLNARLLRPFTFHNSFLETALQQGIRRFPINLRPLVGVKKSQSSKGMGFLARGFIRLREATGNNGWGGKARAALDWLVDHQSAGYSGACWGNHFDYRARSVYLPKGVPTVVWTSLIGHAFLDGFQLFGEDKYLDVATSACRHILDDLEAFRHGESRCITYVPGTRVEVHNANVLGASLLARTYSFVGDERYRDLAQRAIRYTAERQLPNGAWYYGEKENLRWVDNFHTAYVLDSFKHYEEGTGDRTFAGVLAKGYQFWTNSFFLSDGTPRYYDHKTLPIDIQCCSQAIDTLVYFSDRDCDSLGLAVRVARWTIRHMQDSTGYFYYRRYAPFVVNKTPTLHWGQATMLCALAALHKAL
jgi:hypothetical protein